MATQATLIGPFTEQLIAYEAEYNALISQKLTAENELKQLELRYAEKLGHQNQKQKIKYMVDLKKRNLELTEVISCYILQKFRMQFVILCLLGKLANLEENLHKILKQLFLLQKYSILVLKAKNL